MQWPWQWCAILIQLWMTIGTLELFSDWDRAHVMTGWATGGAVGDCLGPGVHVMTGQCHWGSWPGHDSALTSPLLTRTTLQFTEVLNQQSNVCDDQSKRKSNERVALDTVDCVGPVEQPRACGTIRRKKMSAKNQ